MQSRVPIPAALFAALLAVSCGGDSGTSPDDSSGGLTLCANCPGVFRVEITPRESTILVGETAQLSVAAMDPFGNVLDRPVTWTTSSAEIGTVTGAGLVTGVNPGTVTITATSEGRSGTATVQVSSPPA